MAFRLPQRPHLTIAELVRRWNCEEADVRHLIANGDLRPSYVINHIADVVRFVEATEPMTTGKQWRCEEVPGEDIEGFKYTKSVYTDGFYYLLFPERTASLDCRFVYFSKDVNYVQGSDATCLMLGSKQISQITLDDVVQNGAVMMTEIELFEASSVAGPISKQEVLSNRERDNLLRLVIGMAIKGYRYDPRAAKSLAHGEISSDLAELGLGLSDETVRKYLKRAEDLLPARPHQG